MYVCLEFDHLREESAIDQSCKYHDQIRAYNKITKLGNGLKKLSKECPQTRLVRNKETEHKNQTGEQYQ